MKKFIIVIFALLITGCSDCPVSLSLSGDLPDNLCVQKDAFLRGQITKPSHWTAPEKIIGRVQNDYPVVLNTNHSENIHVFSNPKLVNIKPIISFNQKIIQSLKNTFFYGSIFLVLVVLSYLILYKTNLFKKLRIIKEPLQKKQIKRELIMGSLNIFITFMIIFYNDSFLNLIPFNKIIFNDNNLPWWYHVLSFFILMLIYDTLFFWLHYWSHEIKTIYKYQHIVHHLSINPNPLTALNFHPFEMVINYGLLISTSLFIPIHVHTFELFILFHTLFDIYKHSGHQLITIKWDRWLSENFLIGPNYHEVHHTNGKYHLGFFFPYWDKIMKRYLKSWEKPL